MSELNKETQVELMLNLIQLQDKVNQMKQLYKDNPTSSMAKNLEGILTIQADLITDLRQAGYSGPLTNEGIL